jgi:hypothetical protein
LTGENGNGDPVPVPEPAPAANAGDDDVNSDDLQVRPGAVVVPTVPGLPCPAGLPPGGLSDAETARIDSLTRAYAGGHLTRARLAFHYRWSAWRRRHQARARWHHYSTRLVAPRHLKGAGRKEVTACNQTSRVMCHAGLQRAHRTKNGDCNNFLFLPS